MPARELVPGDVVVCARAIACPPTAGCSRGEPRYRRSRAHRRIGAGRKGRAAPLDDAELAARRSLNMAYAGTIDAWPRAGRGRRHRHATEFGRSPAWCRRWKPAARRCRRTSTGWAGSLGKAALVIVALIVAARAGARPAAASTCSSSASPWPWRSCPRRCRRWSRSRWPSASGAW